MFWKQKTMIVLIFILIFLPDGPNLFCDDNFLCAKVSFTGRIFLCLFISFFLWFFFNTFSQQKVWKTKLAGFAFGTTRKTTMTAHLSQSQPQTRRALTGSLHRIALRAGSNRLLAWPLALLTSQVNKNSSGFLLGEAGSSAERREQRPSTKTSNTRISGKRSSRFRKRREKTKKQKPTKKACVYFTAPSQTLHN